MHTMSLSDNWKQGEKEEEERRAQWRLGDYIASDCENCGRRRVCKCANGKHRCEKCNWCPEEKRYVDDEGY